MLVDDELNERQSNGHSKVWDWLAWGLVVCVAIILGVPTLSGSVSSAMLEVMIFVLGLIALPLLIALIWYVFKSIYTMFQYNNLWGILGIITVIFGFYPLLAGVFYFTYELEDEDKTIFKRLFISCFMVVFIGIGSAIVIPALSDNKSQDPVLSEQQFDNAISDMQSQGVENMHQSEIWQNSRGATERLLGDNPSDEKIQAFLRDSAMEVNRHMPVMVEQNVRQDSVGYAHKQIIYNYTITDVPNANSVNITSSMVSTLKADMMREANLCLNSEHLLKYGINLSYVYFATNRDYLFTIDVAPRDCGY